MSRPQVIWFYGDAPARARAPAWQERLGPDWRLLTMGPPGEPPPDLDLGPEPNLSLALAHCPLGLRPRALLLLGPAQEAPAGLAGLPCPTLALAPAPGVDQVLPADLQPATQALREAAGQGRAWPWLERVQVNLPLTYLLGDYRSLVEGRTINLEVGIDAQALDHLDPAELATAHRLLAGRRVSVHLPFLDLSPGSVDPLVAEVSQGRLLAAADWAAQIGALQAVGHLGYLADVHRDLDAFCRRLADRLAPLARRLHAGDCGLALENTFEPAPEVLLAAREALLAADAPEVGFCLDVGHAACFSDVPLPAWWQALEAHIIELHLHDNAGDFDWHLPPGGGCVDWEFVRQKIAEMDPPPLLTLEPHREAHLWATLRALEQVWGIP